MKKSYLFLFPVVALLVYYADVLHVLAVRWWNDPNYSHGFFVPLFSMYFLWERHEQLAKLQVQPGYLIGIPVILSAAFLKVFSYLVVSPYLSGISLILMIGGVVLMCWGRHVARRVWLPIVFLILMLPLPQPVYEAIALPLQRFAAVFAARALQIIDVPVLREGNIINFSGKALEVAQACSGMRLLVGFLAMGVAMAHLSKKPFWLKLVLVVSTLPIAVVANAVRVTGTGILYHSVSEKLAEGFFHAFSGWLMFVVAVGILTLESLVLTKAFVPARVEAGRRTK